LKREKGDVIAVSIEEDLRIDYPMLRTSSNHILTKQSWAYAVLKPFMSLARHSTTLQTTTTWRLINGGCSTHSFSVLLSTVETIHKHKQP